MSVLTRRSGGVTQRGASQLWREGVRPDKGHYGYDPADSSVFPKWYTPLNADFYKVAKDEAVLRDRLCGVRKHPGKYAAAGKGKLNNWTMINRKSSVVVRNPYSGAMDDLGKLVKFEQCEKKGWLRPTMFRVVARDADGAETELFTTMQGVLPWNTHEQWHPSVMRATWNQNSIDVFDALQLLCKENDSTYEPQQLDLTHLPIVRFTEGHPSPPRWKLPVYAASRRHVDKVETGYDESAWNKHPSAFGDHKRNVAYYPEFRGLSMENQLDTHLKNFARHPYNSAGSRGYNAFGVSSMPTYYLGMQTNNEDVLRVVPAETAESYRIWATYENKPSSQKYNNSKDTSTGPWPFAQPIRDADPASVGPLAS